MNFEYQAKIVNMNFEIHSNFHLQSKIHNITALATRIAPKNVSCGTVSFTFSGY